MQVHGGISLVGCGSADDCGESNSMMSGLDPGDDVWSRCRSLFLQAQPERDFRWMPSWRVVYWEFEATIICELSLVICCKKIKHNFKILKMIIYINQSIIFSS